MRLLLDTHALIWFLDGDAKLSERARETIGVRAERSYVSAASAWEVSTKHRIGKLPHAATLAANFENVIEAEGFYALSVTVRHGRIAGGLRGVHKDPFDRMLIAQALIENLVLVSNEQSFDAFGVTRLW